jgi:hypothetical protein
MIGGAKLAWWKLVLIAFLTLSAVAFDAPRPLFISGYVAQLGAAFIHDVAVVPAGSAAANAGMRTGDRLDTRDLSRLEAARFRYQFNLYRVGARIDVPLMRADRPLIVTVTIKHQRVPGYESFVWIVVTLWALTIMIIGCAIVLARPNIVTGAFLAFIVVSVVSSSTNSYLTGIGGASAVPYTAALGFLLGALGLGASVTLSIRFPDGSISRTGRVLEVLGWTAAVVLQLLYFANTVLGRVDALYAVFAISDLVVTVCIVAGFAVRYVSADPALRARLRWVGIGLASLVAYRGIFFSYNLQWLPITYETYTLASMVNILPFTFAYAVLRQRVIDVRFVGGRAVLYAIVSTIPFALFRMTDWLVRTNLEQARIASAIEVIIAVTFGFGISLAQRRVDALVERTFFRARYRAERVVRDIIESLSTLRYRDEVDAAVVTACSDAMKFESAAIFERIESGYEQRHAAGWADGKMTIGETDPLVQRLRLATTAVYLNATDLLTGSAPQGDRRPVIAVPVWRFERLDAVVFVGRHRNGESPDPTEERIIRELARAAGIAYARIDATNLERENIELKRTLQAVQQPAALRNTP